MTDCLNLNILPTPQRVWRQAGWYKRPSRPVARGSEQALQLIEFLHDAGGFPDLPKTIDESRLFRSGTKLLIGSSDALSKADWGRPPRNPEGYRLVVERSSILIHAASTRGLFYGVMTLRQLIRNHSRVTCCVIEDWPDMEVRGIHLDFKGCTPTVEYVKNLIPRLAQYKINTLLMEYEDALRLESLPGVAKPSAWSKADAEAIAALARRYFIDLMPLVQGLGHVEYILRHDAYARYRETQASVQQYCPSHPATLALWKKQADEVIELFPESRYFHVGMDETRQLGQCPRCKRKIGRNGDRLSLYFDRLEQVCDYVRQGGRTPVFWDDMISRYASTERLDRLPRETAIMIWFYYIFSDQASLLNAEHAFHGKREMFSHEWLQGDRWHFAVPQHIFHNAWLDEMPAQVRKRYKRFSERPEQSPFLYSNPFIDMFAERGMEVFGASAAKTCIEGIGLPDLALRLDNVRTWGRQMARAQQKGVVSTSWSRGSSLRHPGLPIDTMWYTMCASAQSYWSAEGASVERFQALFDRDFFGVDDHGWIAQTLEAAASIGSNAALSELEKFTATRNTDVLAAYRLLGRWSIAMRHVLRVLPTHLFSLYLMDHPFVAQANPQSFELARKLSALAEMRPEMETYYRSVMLPEEAQELIDSQFGFLDKIDLGLSRYFTNRTRTEQ